MLFVISSVLLFYLSDIDKFSDIDDFLDIEDFFRLNSQPFWSQISITQTL